MAYSSCVSTLADNIAQDCAAPLVSGYTGRGVLIPYSTTGLTLTKDSSNPRILNAVAIGTSAKVCVLDNVMVDPFTGSSKAGNTDSGYARFTKTLAIRIPMRGAAASKDVIEPLVSQPLGFLLIVEKKDTGAGAFEVLGMYDHVHADPASVSQSESENGGAWTMNLTCTEQYGECEFLDSGGDYDDTLAAFEALIAKGF